MTFPKSTAHAVRPAAPHPAEPGPGGGLRATSPVLLALIAAAVAALLYLPALQYGWVWDDSALVRSHALTSGASTGYHPAVAALYRMEWVAGIGNPAFYHFTSLVLHVLATWLVFLLIRGVCGGAWLAFGAALLFAAHPIHTEAVAYVSGRPDLLATVCALGALVLARGGSLREGGWRSWRLAPALVLLGIGVLADEVALTTPFLLVGLDRWSRPRVPPRDRGPLYAAFFGVATAGLIGRALAHQIRLHEAHELLSPGAGVWGSVIAAYEFLRAMVVPVSLNAMRSLTPPEAASGSLRLAAIASLLALALFVVLRRRNPLARTGALLLALPLLPALPIGPFQGAYVEERAAYFATVGFCALAASLYAWIAGRGTIARGIAAGLALLVAVAAGYATEVRLPVWRSNTALLADAVRHDPRDPAPQLALADQFIADGNVGAALAAVDRAITLDSTQVEPYHKRTLLLSAMGNLPGAEAAARKAVAIQPNEAIFWANLGDILTRQGRIREANEASRRAVTLDPRNADNWYNYAVSLASSDSLDQAIVAYRRAIGINPQHFEAINNLGAALATSGRLAEARDAYQKAVDLNPTSVQARMNLALACAHLGDLDAANSQRQAIERMDPVAAARVVAVIKQVAAKQGRVQPRALKPGEIPKPGASPGPGAAPRPNATPGQP
ncbi:MAG: tetratricopeptide repeat protein [Bacteroidota bacterium]